MMTWAITLGLPHLSGDKGELSLSDQWNTSMCRIVDADCTEGDMLANVISLRSVYLQKMYYEKVKSKSVGSISGVL